jgi:hypothetical protein
MYPNGTGPLDLARVFDTQLSERVRPSYGTLFLLRNTTDSAPTRSLTPTQKNATLAPSVAIRACSKQTDAALAALAANSSACSLAVSSIVRPQVSGVDFDPVAPSAFVTTAVCDGGCVPRLREVLRDALAECAMRWASVRIGVQNLNNSGGSGVPMLLNNSGIIQVDSLEAFFGLLLT